MKDNLISIIIPMYNVEKYIEELLQSINNQKYENYEAILINDGSTDNTETICNKFIKENKRLKYISKKNTGVSDTRNKGISLATGKYICFVDADDILDENYLLDFINLINKNKTKDNLYCCQYKKIYNTEQIDNNTEDVSIVKKYKSKDKYNILYDNDYNGYLWNKVFIKEIIDKNKIAFKKDIYMTEDSYFIFEYLKYIDEVICINKKNYLYRIINSSASKNKNNIKWFTIFKTLDYMISNKNLYTEKLYKRISYAYLYYLYKGKERLSYIKDQDINNSIKKDIKYRISNSKQYYKILDKKQKIKIIIYKLFGNIIFKLNK